MSFCALKGSILIKYWKTVNAIKLQVARWPVRPSTRIFEVINILRHTTAIKTPKTLIFYHFPQLNDFFSFERGGTYGFLSLSISLSSPS
jgi:hypothetical protein